MFKVYNGVEQDFLHLIPLWMGFNAHQVQMIIQCVTTVSYRVVINRNPHNGFILEHLHQGDPLSPCLFIIVVKTLSKLLNKRLTQGCLYELWLTIYYPVVSHLFLVDGSIFFLQATTHKFQELKAYINLYALPQAIQLTFKSLLFSLIPIPLQSYEIKSTIYKTKQSIRSVLSNLQDGFLNKINRQNNKLLSSGGKEVLIEVVAQSLFTYSMLVFQLPK